MVNANTSPEAVEATLSTEEKHTTHLHFSPMGYRCGLVAYTDPNGKGVQILVLPKLWKAHAPLKDRVCIRDNTLQLVVHEKERVPLLFDSPDGNDWCTTIANCIDALQEKEPSNNSDDAESHEADLFDDPTLRKQLRALLTPALGKKPGKGEWVKVSETAEPDLPGHLDRLLRLVLYSGHFKEHHKDYSPTDTGTGYLVDTGTSASDPLRFLTAHAFIEEIKKRQRDVRQGYRIETDRLAVIRGRITPGGMIRQSLTGEPRIECTYDEFTARIPLFQVIVSALVLVAGGTPFPPGYRSMPLVKQIRRDAQQLRRELAHIPALPPATAAALAGRIRLRRLQRPWESALRMARMLLQRNPLDFTSEVQGQGALVWQVDTSKVWEGTLQQLLGAGKDGWPAQEQKGVPAPWGSLYPKNPDLLVRRDHCTYILDAKYKDRSGKAPTPSAAEQYQIFAYSHLVEDQKPRVRCGLLYATSGNTVQCSTDWTRNPERTTVDLLAIAVPFPGSTHTACLTDDQSWIDWLEDHGPKLRDELKISST